MVSDNAAMFRGMWNLGLPQSQLFDAPSWLIIKSRSDLSKDFNGLNLGPTAFDFDSDAPPPPKITNEAIVTTDITAQFITAAKSEILTRPRRWNSVSE